MGGHLSVTDLTAFLRLQSCGRYLAFRAGQGKPLAEAILRRFPRHSDPTYGEEGLKAEEALARLLEGEGFRPRDVPNWAAWAQAVQGAAPGDRLYARQVEVEGRIGALDLKGRMDFVLLDWGADGPVVRVVEGKATRKDRTYHYAQLALYALLLEGQPPLWGGEAVPLEFQVVRLDPGGGPPDFPLGHLDPEERELLEQAIGDMRALLAPGGPVEALLREAPLGLPYVLNARCDACPYAPVCLEKGIEGEEVELLGLKGEVAQALRQVGLETLGRLSEATLEKLKEALLGMETPLRPEHLSTRARARRAQLLGRARPPGYYPVTWLQDAGFGRLPLYTQEGNPLLRVYLAVEKDLVAERLNALVAHVALGEELLPADGDLSLPPEGTFALALREEAWTGDPWEDDRLEGGLIQAFFQRLVGVLRAQAGGQQALPLHLYVWSPEDLKNLVEAILRVGPEGSGLLEGLWHLLGCRESLEQLIYSSLKEEVETRYAVGLTSRSLLAATALPWPGKGRPFPWRFGGQNLRRLFRPWLFDFLEWREDTYREVRTRNYDALPPAYWRAFWGEELRGGFPQEVKEAAPHVPLYLKARALALRWLEEAITPKNREVAKPPLPLSDLPDFRLRAEGVARVALDFLRFEQHVRLSTWLADKTLPPGLRVLNGTALILEGLEPELEEDQRGRKVPVAYRARIRPYPDGFPLKDLEARAAFNRGDFVRVSQMKGPDEAQPLRGFFWGFTAIVEEVDWERGTVFLTPVPSKTQDRYVLRSSPPHEVWPLAAMDPSPSDYVARRVDERLESLPEDHPVNAWFHPEDPRLPPADGRATVPGLGIPFLEAVDGVLDRLVFPNGTRLNPTQRRAIREGFTTRVHLLQGPPGTGKTQVTAVALLLQAQLLLPPGGFMGVAAATHTAVDTLLERTRALEATVRQAVEGAGLPWRPLRLLRLDPSEGEGDKIPSLLGEDRAILFGTTNALLKAERPLSLLVVDEASMMVFPHFLALASLLEGGDWRILLAGDHRQLAPVIQHHWEEEDRPGVQRYLPYLSAFEALLKLREGFRNPDPHVLRSTLDHTHRLPEEVRRLIQPLYRRDDIDLKGREGSAPSRGTGEPWRSVWTGGEGVYLLVHEEAGSRKRNPLEAEIISRVLEAAPSDLGPEEVAVVTPFRAQRTLLRGHLAGRVDLVDTVERLQGGERRVIFYSASASDPQALTELQEFILDANRTNVAFSRAKERLVVVVSRTLLNFLPPEREAYQEAVLWKELRGLCSRLLDEGMVEGVWVRLYVPERNGPNGEGSPPEEAAVP